MQKRPGLSLSQATMPALPSGYKHVNDTCARLRITPPSSCSEGVCGTCKTVLVDGEVDMQHQGGIRPREIAMGKVLICCSRPLTDVVVEA